MCSLMWSMLQGAPCPSYIVASCSWFDIWFSFLFVVAFDDIIYTLNRVMKAKPPPGMFWKPLTQDGSTCGYAVYRVALSP